MATSLPSRPRELPLKPEIECVSSRVVYRNKWMTVREDNIRRADGSDGIYGVVEKNDFAAIAAVQHGQVMLVEQYRYTLGARYWELPQGAWEAGRADPLALARGELREETGLVAETLTHVGRLFLSYGFCKQGGDIYLATGLQQHDVQLEPEEQGLVSRWFSLSEVDAMMSDGRIVDATTVAAFGLLRLKGLL
jgi:ADP-ribose pyrophosphatase